MMSSATPVLFWILAGLTGFSAIATVVTQNIVRSATWLLFTLAGTSGIFFLLGADLVGAIQLLVYVGGTMVLVVFGVMLTAQGPFINMKSSSAEWAISATVGLLLLGALTVTVLKVNLPDPLDVQREWAEREADVIGLVGEKEAKVKEAEKRLHQILDKAGALHVTGKIKKKFEKTPEILKAEKEVALAKLDLKRIERDITPTLIKYSPLQIGGATTAGSHHSSTIGQGFLGVGVGPAHRDKGQPVRMNYLLPFELVSVHLLVVLIGAAYLARAKRHRRIP
jgi:NADH:ubiquinone oxidoreductase subunit 6 (subunit J)